MNQTRLLFRNLFFHWRGNLAILLGAAVGSAVLAGALLVGDSLRGSLRDRAERQLGWVDDALIGGRFFREKVADAIVAPQVSGAILLQGSVRSVADDSLHANKVTVLGVADEHWMNDALLKSEQPVAVVSAPLADRLRVHEGERISVNVQRAANIPRSSVLGRRSTDEAASRFEVTVQRVLAVDDPLNDFGLSPAPGAPFNIWLPLKLLQSKRGVDQPERINAIFVREDRATKPGGSASGRNDDLRQALTLDDWGLKVEIRGRDDNRYVSLESRQLLVEPAVVESARKIADDLKLRRAPTFVYLVNRINVGPAANPPALISGGVAGGFTRLLEIPYSVVAAVDPTQAAPLGPFQLDPQNPLNDDEIVLVDWYKPTLLGAKPGDPITLTFFKPEIEGKVETTTATFKLRSFLPLEGVAADPKLTPDFPGITDRLTLANWDPPFPYESSWVGPRDDQFWQRHRTTPKGYITLAAGQKLWGSRFGDVTSIRFAPNDNFNIEALAEKFRSTLRDRLDPAKGGFVFEPIRQRMLDAGKGSTDFGMLFLAFSFFLILAALMLVALLFRLNLDRRASEVGLLLATGIPLGSVRQLLLREGLILAALGGAVGLVLAPLYAQLMLKVLASFWPTEGVGSFLNLHVTAASLFIGFSAAALMSFQAIYWTLRVLRRVPPSALLNGVATPPVDPAKVRYGSRRGIYIAVGGAVFTAILAVMAPSMPPGEAQAGTFFGSGSMLLIAGLALLWWWLKRPRHRVFSGHGAVAIARFGGRNATRNPTRSLLTTALLASAAFLLVAVESFRRQPERDFLERKGGSGGFKLLAETDVPVPFELTSPDARIDIADNLQRFYQQEVKRHPEGPSVAERLQRAERELGEVAIFPFRLKGGDDASCLNLYQATRPRLLGVPDALIARGGFTFSASEAKTPDEKSNPWLLLRQRRVDKAIPVFVEQNTAVWMLKKGLGDEFEVPGEGDVPVRLRIAGLLLDSVFQSEVLLPDWAFREKFPRHEGFAYFLVDAGDRDAEEITRVLNAAFQRFGMSVTPTHARVAAYLAVQNTYLTTFQLLGGFGLMLGVLGLAVVLLRSVWERRSEFALLRAVGYRKRTLNGLVLAENALLLLLALAIGILAALVSVAPHLAGSHEVPAGRLGAMLGGVVVIGLAVAALATVTTLRAPLIPALRKD